ncbi:hypothetical protein J3R80_03610 [Aliiroseovarius sp. Z3]|uniref:hypothetical protein n=1 Tax=Aliiroseovarius sp. Z3 TaxID=2811402 RepID=UPI0023B2C90F|nr:hypothetical protein [Aliiroseovarius sp. Z3]MDE9449553.1 hypothetical protein [Aliiroseovarius sp. Z3]
MLETATNDIQLRRIYDRAHAERAIAVAKTFGQLRSILRWSPAHENGASLFSQPRKSDCPA